MPLGNHGGFSGARLWSLDGQHCLRVWPPDDPVPERLDWIHQLISKAAESKLAFVPRLLRTRSGASWIDQAGRRWEITTWMPGRADFRAQPTDVRLQSACVALAQLHEAWKDQHPETGLCPAVRRRLQRFHEWSGRLASGWRRSAALDEPFRSLVGRALEQIRHHLPAVPEELRPWIDSPLPLQPCLCDVWHDNLLFSGDTLTGLVDYGSVKIDHVAVDLARLLGSLIDDDAAKWEIGLRAYRGVRPLNTSEEGLARALDRTGVVIAATNWLSWLCVDRKQFDDLQPAFQRFATLVGRMEQWP